jgi:transposase
MDQPPAPAFAGIEVSKDRLDVHLRPSGQSFAVPRDEPDLKQLLLRLRDAAPALVVLEATGGFEVTVAAAIASAGLPLAFVNPRQIRDFARATGRLAKTDWLDAEIISLFAERVRPEPRPVADAEAQTLAELVARRRQIAEMPELGRLDRREAAALIGVAPVNRDSGTMLGHRTIAGGRTSVRNVLFMATLSAIRWNPPIRSHSQQLTARDRPKMVVVACIRKLLGILNAIVRTHQPWRAA